MKAVPIELKDANAYVDKYHRHHKPVARDKFRVACEEDGEIVGVIQVGRPVSRMMDDGMTLEVVRCCTNGRPNVASFLYSRAARIAREMGYKRIITYILDTEHGSSLKASGWELDNDACGGGSWSRPSRPRSVSQITIFGQEEKYPIGIKQRWIKQLGGH